MEEILEPLVRSPRFLSYLDELNGYQRREAEARERFRRSLSEDVREEFINGEVVRHMTARYPHIFVLANVFALLRAYINPRRLGFLAQEQALTGFPRNDYAPDICFWTSAKSRMFNAEKTVFPIPDLICEVLSDSTEERDRGVKFDDYAAHGVGEYWLIQPEEKIFEQYVAVDEKYELVGRFTAGVIRSRVIVGLEFPIIAAFDDTANEETCQKLKP